MLLTQEALLKRFAKAAVVARTHPQRTVPRRAPCKHFGPTKGIKQSGCCGPIQIFACLKLKHDVWHTKCKKCPSYEERKA